MDRRKRKLYLFAERSLSKQLPPPSSSPTEQEASNRIALDLNSLSIRLLRSKSPQEASACLQTALNHLRFGYPSPLLGKGLSRLQARSRFRPSLLLSLPIDQIEYDEGMLQYTDPLEIGQPEEHGAVVAILLYNLGKVNMLQKQYSFAYQHFTEAYEAATSSTSRSESSHVLVPLLHNIGYLQYRSGDLAASLVSYSEALNLAGKSGVHKAFSLNCLAVLHFHLPESNMEKSLELSQTSLILYRETLRGESDDSVIATMLNNIGRVHYVTGNSDMAVATYQRAYRLRKSCLGEDHLDVAAVLFNLGQTFSQKSDLEHATVHYQEFLKVAVPKLGYNHRDVAFVLKCLAQIYHRKGEASVALQLYNQSLMSCRLSLGNHHAEVASVLNKLGNLYFDLGHYCLSLQMYQQGLEIERNSFCPTHPNIAITLSNIAQIYKQQGNFAAAFSLYKEVYLIQVASLGGRHANVAVSLSNMALMHYQSHNFTAALDLYQQALSIRFELFGEDSLDVAATLNSVGLVLFKLGIHQTALHSLAQCLRIRKEELGIVDRDTAITLYNIAAIHTELGNDDEAYQYYKATYDIEAKLLGPDHLDVSLSLSYLAQAQHQRGHIDEAIGSNQEALRIRKLHLDPSHPLIGRTLLQLSNLYLVNSDLPAFMASLTGSFRIAQSQGQRVDQLAQYNLVGLQLYTVAKICPPAAAAA